MKHSDPPKLRLSRAKIALAKKNLRRLRKEGYSLRKIAGILKDQISFQALGRFINERGYIPKDEKVCKLLDLYADPNPYRGLPKWYKRTPEALAFFNEKREQIKAMYNEAKAQVLINMPHSSKKKIRFSCTGMKKDENGNFVYIDQKWIDEEK